MTHQTFTRRAALVLLTATLAACGGGGGGDVGTPAPSPVLLAGIDDTGVTPQRCFAAGSDDLVACDSAAAQALSTTQDGMTGRDADSSTNSNADGRLGFRFSLIDGGCVRDEITGLVWERKTSDGGLRDVNKSYTRFGDGRAGDASEFVAAVNAAGLCGGADWRLPSAAELRTLVDYGVRKPISPILLPSGSLESDIGPDWIDETWFPDSRGGYWSTDGRVWPYRHHPGLDVGYNYPENLMSVRLVRGGNTQLGQDRYQPSTDGQELTDRQTGLVWRRCPEGMSFSAGTCAGTVLALTHEEALLRATAQAQAAAKAWRLPNAKELDGSAGAMPLAPAGTINKYWSSTPSWSKMVVPPGVTYSGPTVSAVAVTPGTGVLDVARSAALQVMLVRAAPP